MIRYLKIFILVLFFASCKPEVPDYVIKPDKMEHVLYDIHIVDAYLGTINNLDSAKIQASRYYKGIYKKFEIDSAKYNVSLSYYYKHPEQFNAILESVKSKLDTVKKVNELRESRASKLVQDKLILKNNNYLRVETDSLKLKFNFHTFPFGIWSSYEE